MKKINIKASLLLIVAMFATFAVNAQDVDHKWSVGAHATFNDYKGDLGDDFWNFGNTGVALTVGRYLSPSFELVGNLSYNKIKTDLAFSNNMKIGEMDNNFLIATLNMKYKFNNGYIIKEDAMLAPYLLAGFGVTWVERNGQFYSKKFNDDVRDEIFNLAVGLTFNLSKKFAVNLETGMYYANSDYYDYYSDKPERPSDLYNDKFLHNSIGIVYKF